MKAGPARLDGGRVVAVFLVAAALLGLADQFGATGPVTHAIFASTLFCALAVSYWWPTLSMAIVTLVVVASFLAEPGSVAVWVPSLVWLVALRRTRSLGPIVALASVVAGTLALFATLSDQPAGVRLGIVSQWLIPLAAATAIGTTWRLLAGRQQKSAQTIARLEQAVAAENERVRREFSSDIHDLIGHELAKINLYSALISPSTLSLDDQQHLEAIRSSVGDAALGLALIVRSANDTDHVPPSAITDSETLSNRLSDQIRAARFEPACSHLDTFDIPTPIGAGVARIATECVTNLMKHGDPSQPCTYSITATDGYLTLTLRNRALGKASNAGVGLEGMAARAQLLGGEMTHQRQGDWWESHLTIPICNN